MNDINRMTARERALVAEVLDSEFRTSRNANMVTRFEQAVCDVFDVAYAVGHVNGTATLHSAVAAAGIRPGDEVIVPPLTMASTTFAALYEGATPIFADIHPETWTLDPAAVEAAITDRTRAIIPVSVYGLPMDIDPLMALADKHGLVVIEDNAECFGGRYNGRKIGTVGHFGSFSFQASKQLTCGEGGVLVTNDEALADRARQFSVVGYDIVRAKRGEITKDVLQSPDYNRHTDLGFKYKMPDLCAAVALGQVERLDELVAARVASARGLLDVIADTDWLIPQTTPDDFLNTYYTFAMRLDTDAVDFSWHDFRKTFMGLGGAGIYAAWVPTFLEPMWHAKNWRTENVMADSRWSDNFSGYWTERCPNTLRIQPQILQFKTNLLSEDRRREQADILARTIAHYT